MIDLRNKFFAYNRFHNKIIQKTENKEFYTRNYFLNKLYLIKETHSSLMDEYTQSALEQQCSVLLNHPGNLSEKQISSLKHIVTVSYETFSNQYTQNELTSTYQILFNMTANNILKETLVEYIHLQKFKDHPIYWDEERSIHIIKNKESIVGKVSKKINNFENVKTEYLAYSLAQSMGDSTIPTTIRLANGNLLQKFLSNSQNIKKLSKKNSLNLTSIHHYLTFSLIRGRKDGKPENTIIHNGKIYDIDEKESLSNSNYSPNNFYDHTTYSCYTSVLGFPEGNKPFSKLHMTLFSWIGLINKSRENMALKERLKLITDLFFYESHKKKSTLTPRDLYLFLHRKEFLYAKLKGAGYRDDKIFSYFIRCKDTFSPQHNLSRGPSIVNLGYQISSIPQRRANELAAIKTAVESNKTLHQLNHKSAQFDAKGWSTYKKLCQKNKRPRNRFLISYFSKDILIRGITRQFLTTHPNYFIGLWYLNKKPYLKFIQID